MGAIFVLVPNQGVNRG